MCAEYISQECAEECVQETADTQEQSDGRGRNDSEDRKVWLKVWLR